MTKNNKPVIVFDVDETLLHTLLFDEIPNESFINSKVK
jgi:phosphoserine phosphatase